MKILTNAHISVQTIQALQSMGHEVTEPPAGLGDPEILEAAKAIGAVVITQDLDFSNLLARSKDTSPSVVSLRLQRPHPTRVTDILRKLLNDYEDALQKGAILSVDDTGTPRVRFLPIVK